MKELEMEFKVIDYCLNEYNTYLHHGGDLEKAIDRCYGAVMFAINNCFETYNESLAKWWENEMLPKFRKLKKE